MILKSEIERFKQLRDASELFKELENRIRRHANRILHKINSIKHIGEFGAIPYSSLSNDAILYEHTEMHTGFNQRAISPSTKYKYNLPIDFLYDKNALDKFIKKLKEER